ncbi:MAG: hypothetical protein ACKVU0_18765 [Saprospiraceae bacterium]
MLKVVHNKDSIYLAAFMTQTEIEIRQVQAQSECRLFEINHQMITLDELITREQSMRQGLTYICALEEKLRLQEALRQLEYDIYVELLRVRYLKGLDLIKLLYEKVLSLDHHFATIQTMHHVSTLSNPNAYPAFQENHKHLEERLKKKSGVRIPALLQSNPFVSTTFSLVAALLGDGEPKQKEQDLEEISCILDFTLRMSNDLNTIYYETEYLKHGNESLKEDIMALFSDYTKPIGYMVALDKCRKNDDWEAVNDALEKTLKEVEAGNKDPNLAKTAMRHRNNMEFSIDRLLDFLDKYTAFVSQGEKYYQKFLIIVGNYANAAACETKMPKEFAALKKDIEVSIEKFNTSYKLTELKGSKLKDLLYGLPD